MIILSDDISINTFFMPISVNKYREGKHVIAIEKFEYYNFVEDSSEQSTLSFDEAYKVELSKRSDSLINIPFYIYR